MVLYFCDKNSRGLFLLNLFTDYGNGDLYVLFCLFHLVWMYIGLIGGLFFILFQLVFLIDFAHSWNESW